MASVNDLPPDQRAVLELVLGAGRSYDEIAKILSIDRAGVRERALAALDALGPQTQVPSERRGLITDYLLGALPARVAAEVHERLVQSASERAWARAVASELRGIAKEPLPEIPAEAPEAPAPSAAAAHEPTTAAAQPPRGDRPSSRVGGAVLLAGGAVVAVLTVVLVLVLTGGSSKRNAATAQRAGTTTHGATTPSSTSTNPAAHVVSQIALRPPSGGSTPLGLADVLRVQGRTGIAIVAQGLTANSKHPPNAYAVWLSNSGSDSFRLGFVNPSVGSNGQLRTAGALPTNASHFQKVLVTLETQSNPRTPGTIVLEGTLSGV